MSEGHVRLLKMHLADGRDGIDMTGDGTEVYTGEEVEWCQVLSHAEAVRLHAWLTEWLAEHGPRSRTEW